MPRLGVYGEAHQGGCLVTDVVPGSAADTAGLQAGDVITAVDGEPVADIPGIARVIRKHQLGDTVSVEFLRGERAHQADVRLGETEEIEISVHVGRPGSTPRKVKFWTVLEPFHWGRAQVRR